MVDEKLLSMKSGFAPYADGSGFAVTVEIEQEGDTNAATIRVSMIAPVNVDLWPDICEGINRMLKALP